MGASLTLSSIQAARVEYRVSVGDVLEITAAGVSIYDIGLQSNWTGLPEATSRATQSLCYPAPNPDGDVSGCSASARIPS
jgi:hypothetical protein